MSFGPPGAGTGGLPPVNPLGIGGGIRGIGGTAGGSLPAPAAAFAGRWIGALQLVQFTSFVPAGTSASAKRLTVPQPEQVASIMRRKSYPARVRIA